MTKSFRILSHGTSFKTYSCWHSIFSSVTVNVLRIDWILEESWRLAVSKKRWGAANGHLIVGRPVIERVCRL